MTQNLADAVFGHPFVQAKAVEPAPMAAVPAPAPAATLPPMPRAAPVALTFPNQEGILRRVPMAFPFEWNGAVHAEVVVRRMTARQVADFVRDHTERKKVDPDAPPFFPMFFTVDGTMLPPEVLDALISDDNDSLDEAALDFLPRRFKQSEPATPATATATPASSPTSGAATGPTLAG